MGRSAHRVHSHNLDKPQLTSTHLKFTYPRYMVASRDIPACQLILREAPALQGPYSRTSPVCLQCYAKVGCSRLVWLVVCSEV